MLLSLGLLALAPASGHAALFDVAARRAELASEAGAAVNAICQAPKLEADLRLAPVEALGATDGYGSDNRSADFAWAAMALAGKALAGDPAADAGLRDLLRTWAGADALGASADVHDAHFALKRTLLPTIVAFTVVRDGMAAEDRARVGAWLARLTAKIDRTFDGDVDLNNHRYLTDSVLAAWGVAGDRPDLLRKARARLEFALTRQLRPDGSFPLEARRGARALWYHRQTMASLTVIVMALRQSGVDPLQDPALAASWRRMTLFLLDGLRTPRIVLRYAAENYIPGPGDDFERQDLGFLDPRGHGRHYLAWAAAARGLLAEPYATERFERFFVQEAASDGPLIDEFSGGAATCFWRAIAPKGGGR